MFTVSYSVALLYSIGIFALGCATVMLDVDIRDSGTFRKPSVAVLLIGILMVTSAVVIG